MAIICSHCQKPYNGLVGGPCPHCGAWVKIRDFMVRTEYVLTDDEHGYLKAWPVAVGSWLMIERFCTPDPTQALRWTKATGAYKAMREHHVLVGKWRVVGICP